MQNFDIQLFHLINAAHNHIADNLMQAISAKWTWLPCYALAFFFIWKKEKIKNVMLFLLCISLAVTGANTVTSSLLKPLIKRPRPCQIEANLPFKVHIVDDYCGGKYGFPSSHAANFMTMAVMLSFFFRRKKASILFFTCALLVGYSRIYLGVHYPIDVLAGFAMGGVIAYLCWKLYQKFLFT